LLLPLEAEWRAFECEVELTRRSGRGGMIINIPTAVGECPAVFAPLDFPGLHLGRRNGGSVLNDQFELPKGKRTTLRLEVRPEQNQDHVSVWVDGVDAGTWQGDRTSIANVGNDGYSHARRLSLWIQPGGNFVFHSIRVRMLDGHTAESLRPTPSASSSRTEQLASTFKNSIGMEFVLIPKGKAWLGGGNDRQGHYQAEMPTDFYLGKYEVTQEQWEKVMGENPSFFSRNGGRADAVKDVSDADLKRFPVELVSWNDCQAFVAKLNRLQETTGWVYRLPNKLEWEYACRGGPMLDKQGSEFDFYLSSPTNTLLPGQANFDQGLNRTCLVGSYAPNRLGLFDMHGNVAEWCDDALESGRMIRGGAWKDDAKKCRAQLNGLLMVETGHADVLGLRLAIVPADSSKTPPALVTKQEQPPLTHTTSPFTDADVRRIAALPAKEQVEEVKQELMRRNPGFDGTLEPLIKNGVVTELRFSTVQVKDIAPFALWSACRNSRSATTQTAKARWRTCLL
jgi:formylglycine-generating enzyme required for sulfatase activity